MPIRREHRFFYPIDWRELSAAIRFRRAGGRCDACSRPHGRLVYHLGDGRWWDTAAGRWRDGRGRLIRVALTVDVLAIVRTTRVVLAAVHRNHDTADNADANLAAFCQRCHMLHDRLEHLRRRWRTLFRRPPRPLRVQACEEPHGQRGARDLPDQSLVSATMGQIVAPLLGGI